MDLLIQCAIFACALFILVKSADYFIEAAENLGKWAGIPTFVIGVTIVALGTSFPELITALIAVYQGSSEIVLGNVVGSNVANILLILGTSALFVRSMNIKWNVFYSDLPMFFASGILLYLVAIPINTSATYPDTYITLGESIILLGGYVVYTTFTLVDQKSSKEKDTKNKDSKANSGEYQEILQHTYKKGASKSQRRPVSKKKSAPHTKLAIVVENHNVPTFPWTDAGIFIASLVGVFLGARFTIDSVIEIAKILNIGKEVIAISAVAIGTSLPELIVSISAVRKKKYDIAFGNIAGSNIFNIFAVVGIPGIYSAIIGKKMIVSSSINDFAIPFMMLTYVLFLVIMLDKKITRMEGLILLLCYAIFMGKLFAWL